MTPRERKLRIENHPDRWLAVAVLLELLTATVLWLLVAISITHACGQLSLTNTAAALVSAQARTNRGFFVATWTPSADTNVAAYRLAWGATSNALNSATQVGKSATRVTITNLPESVTLHVALTSVTSNGVESLPERSTIFVQPGWRTGTHATFFDVTLAAGRTNTIQSSTNAGRTWRNILTNTTGGEVRLVRTNGVGVMEWFRVN